MHGHHRRTIVVAAVMAAGFLPAVTTVGPAPVATASHSAAGAPIFIGGDVTGVVDVFSHDGLHLDDWDGNFTSADGFTSGDVTGDGVDEVLIAGDVTGTIDIFDQTGRLLNSFDGDFTLFDGFASGDVTGDGIDEILVAGDFTGTVDVFTFDGTKIKSFDGDFTLADGFAAGNVTGDVKDEILVAGDVTGTVDVFDLDGDKLMSFDGDYTLADGFAAGNVTGNTFDEILVAGDATGIVDVFSAGGSKLASFDGNFTFSDGFAVGDVDGDTVDDIVIAGDVTGQIDVFDVDGDLVDSFDGNFTSGDGFAVGRNPYPDADLDGLLDFWETNGLDADGNGSIDVDLPSMGADPQHKDLFLELDFESGQAPTRADILAMKAAFAAAPLANPDGTTGVTVHVDTGGLVDPIAREDQALGTCADGIDNGGDGLTDGGDPNDCVFLDGSVEDPGVTTCANGVDNDGDGLIDGEDPDCLVGDNLGGGSQVNAGGACELDSNYFNTKTANFNADRRLVFRYAISASLPGSCSPTGGQGEIGGNDFIDFNHDGGTLMHELGHNLDLHHGGDVDDNCKPNFVSGMNYDAQFGINRAGGGVIIDYAPPRIAVDGSSRGTAPLATIVEDNLNESVIFDGTDGQNRFVFVNGNGAKVQNALNTAPDWDGDGNLGENPVTVNVNTSGTNGRPGACTNGDSDSTLTGSNDWSRVSIRFRQFGDSDSSAINPELEPVPTLEDLQLMQQELNTTDLQLTVSDSPDPVAAGTQLTYSLTVRNDGPNPATAVQVVDTLPGDVSFSSASAGCAETGGVVTCNLGEILTAEEATVSIVVDVPADLVYNHGSPKTITNSAVVSNLAGPDAAATDNTRSNDTLVIAVADLEILDFGAIDPPLDLLIGEPVDLTLEKVITSRGPSSPMDTDVDVTATATAGATVSPSAANQVAVALVAAEQRTIEETFTIECTAPGEQSFTFDNVISPDRPDDVDPDLSNNAGQVVVTVDCVVPVAINIRPKGFPNSINLSSVTSLAVLTTQAGEYGLPLAFDATTIKPLTVRFGSESNLFDAVTPIGASEVHGQGHIERSYELDERTSDRDNDMVLHFVTNASGLTLGTTEACVKGKFTSGPDTFTFFGCDSVIVRP